MAPEGLIALVLAPFVGSFLGVVVRRLPAGRPLALGRSACETCGRALGPGELVPLLSWLWQRGRCGCGRVALSPFYPAIELAALAVALSAAWLLSGWLLRASLALGWTLLALAAIDLRHYLLPDVLTLPLIPAGLAVAGVLDPGLLGRPCPRRRARLCGLRGDRADLPPVARPPRPRPRRCQAARRRRRLARLGGLAERRGDRRGLPRWRSPWRRRWAALSSG